MTPKSFLLIALACGLGSAPCSAYEVWIGLHCTPKSAATQPAAWALTAAKVQGVNANLAPFKPTPGTPNAKDSACSKKDWKTVIGKFAAKEAVLVEIPRSAFGPTGRHAEIPMEKTLEGKFADAKAKGYGIGRIMFYDNATGTPKVSYSWTTAEVEAMRAWLDANGHRGIKLLFDARNNGAGVRKWCSHRLVDEVMLEMNRALWDGNLGSRHELLAWLWKSTTKKIVFQITTQGNDPYDTPSAYQDVRQLVRSIGSAMGPEFNASPRVVYMPVNYGLYTYAPETLVNGTAYGNTLTGLTLSLLEQRAQFESGVSEAFANSSARTIKQVR